MAHHTMRAKGEDEAQFECRRCGARSSDEQYVRARYCAICGCHEVELADVPAPAAVGPAEPVTGVHRLPVA